MRRHSRLVDQAIGGGFRGGSERVSKAYEISKKDCAVALVMGSGEIVAVAVAPSVQETRQSAMESDPSGQQGQGSSPAGIGISSQGISAAAGLPLCADAMAGAASSSWAAIRT
jgi:hypothetical protein